MKQCDRRTTLEGWKKEIENIFSNINKSKKEIPSNEQQKEELKDQDSKIPCDICGQGILFENYETHYKTHKAQVNNAPEIADPNAKIPCDLCGEEILFSDYHNHAIQKHSPPQKAEIKKEIDPSPSQEIYNLFKEIEKGPNPPIIPQVKKEAIVPIIPAKIEEPPSTKCEACGVDIPNEEYLTHVESHFQVMLSRAPSENSYLPKNETQLLRTPFSGKGEDNTCKICYIEYSVGESLIFLPCLHEYHEHCLLDWLRREPICPICLKTVYKEIKQEN